MAKTTVVTTTDDLDGSFNAQPVTFAFQGHAYQLDLGKKNLAALEAALSPYIAGAKSTGRPAVRTNGKKSTRRRTGKSASTASITDFQAVRAWAGAQGLAVATRGRISAAIVDAFHAAQG